MSEPNLKALKDQLAGPIAADLEALIRDESSILAALVCTTDGFEIASVHQNAESNRRMAAMVSSLNALGEAMVGELTLGTYHHLAVEASDGKCVLFAIAGSRGSLLLAAVTRRSLLWGHLLFHCRTTCDAIGKHVEERLAAQQAQGSNVANPDRRS